jgi:hypothetical protein
MADTIRRLQSIIREWIWLLWCQQSYGKRKRSSFQLNLGSFINNIIFIDITKSNRERWTYKDQYAPRT